MLVSKGFEIEKKRLKFRFQETIGRVDDDEFGFLTFLNGIYESNGGWVGVKIGVKKKPTERTAEVAFAHAGQAHDLD